MSAADLVRLVEALGAPYGLERSVKITPGHLADDRCLISIGRVALGISPADRLHEIGQALKMPPLLADELRAALDGADIVHFGFEAAKDDEIYKIYLEYASQVRQAMAAGSRTPGSFTLPISGRRGGRTATTSRATLGCRAGTAPRLTRTCRISFRPAKRLRRGTAL